MLPVLPNLAATEPMAQKLPVPKAGTQTTEIGNVFSVQLATTAGTVLLPPSQQPVQPAPTPK